MAIQRASVRWCPKGTWIGAALLVLVPTSLAFPAETRESLRLHYDVPPECPERAAFERLVESLSPEADFVPPEEEVEGEETRQVRIQIEERDAVFSAELIVDEPLPFEVETQAARRFTDASCSALAEALALSIALALNPKSDEKETGGVSQEEATPAEPPPDTAPAATSEEDSGTVPTASPRANERSVWFGAEGKWSPIFVRTGPSSSTGESWQRGSGAIVLRYQRQGPRWGWLAEGHLGAAKFGSDELSVLTLPFAELLACPQLRAGKPLYLAACLGIGASRQVSEPGKLIEGSQGEAVRTIPYWSSRLRVGWTVDRVRLELWVGSEQTFSEIEYRVLDPSGEDQHVATVTRQVVPQAGGSVLYYVF